MASEYPPATFRGEAGPPCPDLLPRWMMKKVRAPASDPVPGRANGTTTQPRHSCGTEETYLPLLPSGPDGVGHAPLAQDLDINTAVTPDAIRPASLGQASAPVERVPGYRAPLVPHLARTGP